jgi:hypothetical protein
MKKQLLLKMSYRMRIIRPLKCEQIKEEMESLTVGDPIIYGMVPHDPRGAPKGFDYIYRSEKGLIALSVSLYP